MDKFQKPNHPIRLLSSIMITRRALLRLALLCGIGLGLGVLRWRFGQAGSISHLRWMLQGAWWRLTGEASPVAVVRCPSYQDDVLAALRQGWEEAGATSLSLRGRRVVIKPNLVGYIPGPPANTHPRVLEAAIVLCKEQGAREIVVAEGMAFLRDPRPVLEASGVAALLSRLGVDFVDLNYDDLVEVPLSGGYSGLQTLSLPRTVMEADLLISLAKMKTHHWSGLSLSLKNLFGIVPGLRYGWPKNVLHLVGIPKAILDLYQALRAPSGVASPGMVWGIVDGIEGMEGDGPLLGSPVPSGALVVGRDLVAVDATCARLMGCDPLATDYLQAAQAVGLGWADASRIAVRGVPISALQRAYMPAPGY